MCVCIDTFIHPYACGLTEMVSATKMLGLAFYSNSSEGYQRRLQNMPSVAITVQQFKPTPKISWETRFPMIIDQVFPVVSLPAEVTSPGGASLQEAKPRLSNSEEAPVMAE